MQSQLSFFKEISQGVYQYKQFKVGVLVVAIMMLLIAGGCAYLTFALENQQDVDLVLYGAILLFLVLGVYLFLSASRKVTINKKNNLIEVKSIITRKRPIDQFYNYEIIKNYYNGAYTGTTVNLLFDVPNKKNYKKLMLTNIRKTKKVDQFVDEVDSILS